MIEELAKNGACRLVEGLTPEELTRRAALVEEEMKEPQEQGVVPEDHLIVSEHDLKWFTQAAWFLMAKYGVMERKPVNN
jgi:hypothetical protein